MVSVSWVIAGETDLFRSKRVERMFKYLIRLAFGG
jgi:hypothetical protein